MNSFRRVLETQPNYQRVEMYIPKGERGGVEVIKPGQRITLLHGEAYVLNNNNLEILTPNSPKNLKPNTKTDILNTSENKDAHLIIEYNSPVYHPRLHQTVKEK